MNEMTVNQNRSQSQKYGIPLEHMDFDYVNKCEDPKELKRIIKILESGEEGYYPKLLMKTVDRLRQIKPDASILNKNLCFAQKSSELPVNGNNGEVFNTINDIAQWIQKSNEREKNMPSVNQTNSTSTTNGHDVKPVRGFVDLTPVVDDKQPEKKCSKPKSCGLKASYSKWDKYDPDVELVKLDNKEKVEKLEEHRKKRINSNCLSVGLNESTNTSNINDRANSIKSYVDIMSKNCTFKPEELAMREKELGNECFKSNDYEEALNHYNASISIHSTPEAKNNRAMSFIKLKKYEQALDDLREVIESDPKNVKAHFRRGSCFKAISMYCLALRSFEVTLKYDCNNLKALNFIKELRNSISNIPSMKLVRVREITRHYDQTVWDIEEPFRVSYDELAELNKENVEYIYEADNLGCLTECVCKLCPSHESLRRKKKWGRHKLFKNEKLRKRWQLLTPDIVSNTLVSRSLTPEVQMPKRLNITEINSAKINGHHNNSKMIQYNGVNGVDKSPCEHCDDNELIMKPVCNVQEFLLRWKTASKKNSFELYHKLLRSIKPKDLPKVISTNLDEEIMSKFLEILNQKFDPNSELDLIIEYLTAMTKVNRFNIIVKMLDNKVKEGCQPLLKRIHHHTKNNLFLTFL